MVNDDPVDDNQDETILLFPEEEAWRTNVTQVRSGATVIPESGWDAGTPGEITLGYVFPVGTTIVYTIVSTGYPDKEVTVTY
ncbi:hemoblobin-interacting domain-containing protein [Alkalicoccus urumqiensis]|uniref:Heme-binding protein Shr-like Hb-interacting domain-containing protein n=1 Tax=Alkalicoccus urumqiensis TaxID=1548213 RepID=A0A2P6MHR3_ALKUR|nr:hypothetical protein [Alkalicoccus urumqiensis]PRO65816.1 hypothetical protein C6I21_07920 [Alkalicoccus urumqiensis]